MDLNTPEESVRGRRIFDLNYLFHQVKEASKHGENNCGWMDVDLVREVQDGLWSSFEFKCRECQFVFYLRTSDDHQKGLNMSLIALTDMANVESSLDAILKVADLPPISGSAYNALKASIESSEALRPGGWPTKKTCHQEPQRYQTLVGTNSATNDSVENMGLKTNETHACSSNKKRVKNRYECSVRCLYCGKVILHRSLLIHFLRKHRTEEEIRRILSLQKNHPRRAILLKSMKRKCENFFKGPSWKKRDPNYIPCANCRSLYRYGSYSRHCIDCSRVGVKNKVKISQILKTRQEQETENIKDFKIKVLLGIKTEIVRNFINGDAVLTEYGVHSMNLVLKKGVKANFSTVRSNLYMVVTVFFVMREKYPEISGILDVFNPKLWGAFIEAIHEYTRVRSILRKLRQEFYKISRFAAAHCRQLEINVELLYKWLPLFKNNHIQVVRQRRRWENLSWFTVTERLAGLFKFAHDELRCSLDALKNTGFDSDAFETLNHAAMLEIMSYNRNRVLDLEKMLIVDFEKRQNVTRDTDVWKCLDESEKFTAERCKYFEIRSKGRTIAVLLDAAVVDAIETILVLREKSRVSSDNPFVFGDCDTYYKINSAIDNLASKCGVETSCTASVITSGDLKKYVACMSHALSMNNNDVAILGKFLASPVNGSSVNVSHSSTDDVMVRLAKLFRVLVALNEENIDDLRGLNMNDVDVAAVIANCGMLSKVCQHVAADALRATDNGNGTADKCVDIPKPAECAPSSQSQQDIPYRAAEPASCVPVVEDYSLTSDFSSQYPHAAHRPANSTPDSSMNYNVYKPHHSSNCREGQQVHHPLISTMPYTSEFPYYSSQYEVEAQRSCMDYLGFQPSMPNRWPVQNFSPDFSNPSKLKAMAEDQNCQAKPNHRRPRSKSPSSKIKRISWTSDEKRCLLEFFGPDIFTDQKLPSYYACEKAIVKYGCLHMRTKAQVKAFINNEQRKWKKRVGQTSNSP